MFRTNQVQMKQNAVGRWQAGGGLQVSSAPWLMIGICSLSVLVLHETLLAPVLVDGSDNVMERGEI